jgi:hypothetical protein
LLFIIIIIFTKIRYGAKTSAEEFLGLVWWLWAVVAGIAVLVAVLVPLIYYQLNVKGRYDEIGEGSEITESFSKD